MVVVALHCIYRGKRTAVHNLINSLETLRVCPFDYIPLQLGARVVLLRGISRSYLMQENG